jgi:HD-like signal output (HDOD) protein
MDETALSLLLAALGLVLFAGLAAVLRSKLLDSRSRVAVPRNRLSATGIREEAFPTAPKGLAPGPMDKGDIDLCLDRIFIKRTESEQYKGVVMDDIPNVVLHLLDKIIERNAFIKQTHALMGKIDALENNVEGLVDLVGTDPLLAATVMRQASSTLYGVRGNVTSLKFAIELLGLSALKNLVYREYVLREHKGKAIPDPSLFKAVWEHALLTATAAAYLAHAFPGVDPAQAYTVGLLHDIGKFLLLNSNQVETAEDRCVRPYCGGFSRDTALVWRHDHALAGKIAALKWEFGPEVASAIGMHHYPALMNLHRVKADPGLIQTLMLTHVANQVAKHFSGDPRQANYIVPLHFSYHHQVDRGVLRAVLAGSNLIAELANIKVSMAFKDGL